MPESALTDPLQLEKCPGCGYWLEGLPPEGRCPECGRGYDPDIVVLYGWSRGTHANVHTSPPWIAAGLWLLQSVGFIGVLINPASRRAGLLLPLAASWTALTAWIVWKRFDRDAPSQVQVHFDAAGCRQIDAPRSASTAPWDSIARVDLYETAAGRHRLRLGPRVAWWVPVVSFPVDAEVFCTPEQAAALRGRIASWRRASGGAGLAA